MLRPEIITPLIGVSEFDKQEGLLQDGPEVSSRQEPRRKGKEYRYAVRVTQE